MYFSQILKKFEEILSSEKIVNGIDFNKAYTDYQCAQCQQNYESLSRLETHAKLTHQKEIRKKILKKKLEPSEEWLEKISQTSICVPRRLVIFDHSFIVQE